jgi:hypothetical protein
LLPSMMTSATAGPQLQLEKARAKQDAMKQGRRMGRVCELRARLSIERIENAVGPRPELRKVRSGSHFRP